MQVLIIYFLRFMQRIQIRREEYVVELWMFHIFLRAWVYKVCYRLHFSAVRAIMIWDARTGAGRILYPGQLEQEKERAAIERGLDMPEAAMDALRAASEACGMSLDIEQMRV